MRHAFIATFALALLLGVWLVWRGGIAIALIGALGIACGILYTGGPRPLGYLGLGELLVLVFFGPVATAGTFFVQALDWRADAAVAGIAPGALATCLLVVNNLRDIDTDRVAGKRTLAVRCGDRFGKAEYLVGLATAAVIPVVLWRCFAAPALVLLASLTVLTAAPALADVVRARPGDRLQRALAGTGRALAVFGAVLAAALVLG
jgi:1,4-dihydroxy-2-naphthoate octaprenyltransferase